MIRAIIRGGQIHPIEPIPSEWSEGHEVVIEDAGDRTASDLEEWYRELQELGPALSGPGEWEDFQAILAEADELARATSMNATLLTSDRDFVALSDLRVENWLS